MIQTVENIGEKLISMLTYDASQPLIFSSGLFLFSSQDSSSSTDSPAGLR